MSDIKDEISKADRRKKEKIRRKKRNQNIMIIFTVFIIIVGAVYLISMGNTDDKHKEFNPVSDDFTQTTTQIEIPISSITNEATFFNYESNEVDIKYFAVIGDDDQVHVATDACDVCYHSKEGYRQMNDVMECINCGLTFPIVDLGEKNTVGGCWPSFIPFTIENGNVIIDKSDLDSKRFMFE